MSRRPWSYVKPVQKQFFFSEQEIDFTSEQLNYQHFLLQEFFTSDLENRLKIEQHYSWLYGEGACAYLKRNFGAWARGEQPLSQMIKDRLIVMMPKFLTEKAKLKLALHDFMYVIKTTVTSFLEIQTKRYKVHRPCASLQCISNIFEEELFRIDELTLVKNRYSVLSEDDKAEAHAIACYILEKKLQSEYEKFKSDILLILPKAEHLKNNFFSAEYYIHAFGVKVDFRNTSLGLPSSPKFKNLEIDITSRFEIFANKFLATQLISIDYEKRLAEQNALLTTQDLLSSFDYCDQIKTGVQEVEVNFTLNGGAGELRLRYKYVPTKIAIASGLNRVIKITTYAVAACASIVILAYYGLFGVIIITGLYYGIAFSIGLVVAGISAIKNLFEYLLYGKQ